MRRLFVSSLLILSVMAGCAAHPASAPPSFSPTQTTLDFGPVSVGATAQKSFTFSTSGARQAAVFVSPGAVPAGFTIDLGPDVPWGQERTATVTFAPTASGAAGGPIYIEAGNASMKVKVVGLGVGPVIETQPGQLNFGSVLVGRSSKLPLQVHNPTSLPERIVVGSSGPSFSAAPDAIDLEPGASTTLDVTFRPASQGWVSASLKLAPCADCQGKLIPLAGYGATQEFTVTPSPLDFGNQPVGSTTCRDVAIENTGESPVMFWGADLDPPFSATGPFELQIADLLDGTPLAAGDIRKITVCFSPRAQGSRSGAVINFLTTGNLTWRLEVLGFGGVPELGIYPSILDLGATTPGVPVTLEVMLRNVGAPGSVVIGHVSLDGIDPAFSLAFPGGDPSGSDVGSQQTWVNVTLAGGLGLHTASLTIEQPGGEALVVPVRGWVVDGAPCEVSAPAELEFGEVSYDASHVLPLRIDNPGTVACYVWGFLIDPESPFSLVDAPAEPVAIEPGSSLLVHVLEAPMGSPSVTTVEATLRFRHLGSPDPVTVRLSAFPTLSALEVTPDPIDFGDVPVGFVMHLPITLTNETERLIKVGGNLPTGGANGDIALTPDSSPAFTLTGVPERLPYTIPGHGSMTLTVVVFQASTPGHYEATLEIWGLNAAAPILVPIFADAVAPACTTPPCADFGVICPDPISGHAGTTYDFTGQVFDPGPSSLACTWELIDWPPGSTARLTQQEGCKASLKPEILGTYAMKVTARNSIGATSTCQTQLKVAEYSGLTVETTWGAPDDLDLHLFHPGGGDPSLRKPWFDLTYDCYYGNDFPYWDSTGRADDPHLVADDQTGRGPEKINVPAPSTAHGYVVGLHWFADVNRIPSETATTRISCDGKQVAEVQTVLTRVYEAAVLGTVTWNGDGTCNFVASDATLQVVP